jgi:MFS transporter, DHA1 family, purine base/nucleoside efflux pump
MNKRVYFLMIITFVIGMVELIIGGIVDLIAEDLEVSLAQAGFLISIFSIIFAIAGPVLLIWTGKYERKKLTLVSLLIFLAGNIITVFSPTYPLVLFGRIVTATSGALLIILCLTMAPNMVEPKYRGRAIGTVSMGVSASLVLGVPIGLMLGNSFGWRAPFVFITILTILSTIGVYFLMNKVEPLPSPSIRAMLSTLKRQKVFLAHATTFLYMTGHTALYAYLKPYLSDATGLEGNWVSVIYFLFGIAAVSGGGIGGTLADRFGSNRTIIISIIVFSALFFGLPLMTSILPIFLVGIVIWGVLSWAISPAMQTYLIETSPSTGGIQQSLSNSSLHLGIAFGAFVGGLVIEYLSIEQTPLVGGIFIATSLVTAILSTKRPALEGDRDTSSVTLSPSEK